MWLVSLYLAEVTPPIQSGGKVDIVVVISILVGAIFGTGGLVAFFTARSQNKKMGAETLKLRAETEILPIDLAKGAVVVQADVIKDLREQIDSQDARIRTQMTELIEVERKRDEAANRADRAYRKLDEKCSKLQDKFQEVLSRMEAILSENARLKDQNEDFRDLIAAHKGDR